ncbi:MAG: arylesterase [Pseudomonadota bacterium]
MAGSVMGTVLVRCKGAVGLAYGAARRGYNLLGSLGLALGLAWPAGADDTLRIVALGDSLVHGYGLEQGSGFVPQLDGWLEAQGLVQADVINAGVSGDTTAGGLARFEWSLSGGADALIVVLGGNDLLRGIDPATSRTNLDAILTQAGERGLPVLLAGLSAPNNYGADWKQAFDAMYPALAEKHGALHYPQFLAGVVEDRSLWQPDGIHPNAKGVGVIVEGIGPLVVQLVARTQE